MRSGRALGQDPVEERDRWDALRVGVTGHRPDRLQIPDLAALRAVVREVLAVIGRASGGRVTVVSPLAEGADQLAAAEALAAGFQLVCPLPFPADEYTRDFASPASAEAFRALLTRASAVEELPGSRATPEDERAAYAAVGARVLDGADLLLTIWDGRRARGPGGTAEIVVEARRRGVPTVWIEARPPHGVRVLAGDNGPQGESLDALAKRLIRDRRLRFPSAR